MRTLNSVMSRYKTTIDSLVFDFEKDKIVLDLKNDENIVQLSRKDEKIYEVYIELLKNDYMFYMHKNKESYFIKRNKLYTIWKRKDLKQYNDVFYKVEEIPENRINALAPKRLVVVFSSMPPAEDYLSDNIAKRCFTQNYPSIQKHLIKNTIIARIMDTNLSNGSMYLNTPNYPNYEKDIQELLKKVQNDYEISKENTVLYGVSKGGTGALYHGFLGNYKSVVVDPILSLQEHNDKNDLMFLKNFRKVSVESDIQSLNNNQTDKIILGNPLINHNYDIFKKFEKEKVKIIDILDNNIEKHPDISKNSVTEQIYFINKMLLNPIGIE